MLKTLGILLIGMALGIGSMVVFRSVAGEGTAVSNGVEIGSGPGANQIDSALPSRNSIVALGTLEPRNGIVQISSSLVGYRIKQVHVQEGQLVKAGADLIDLDASPAKAEHELALAQQAEAVEKQQAEVDLARQRVAAAELSVRQASEGRELELQAQKSRVSVADARRKQAERDLERLSELHKLPEPLASDQQVEQQRLMLDSAAAEQGASEAALKRLEQSLTFQEQTAAAELRAAQQSLALAEKGTGLQSLARHVEIAELKLQQTKITAPAAGVVLNVHAHPGEIVPQQPLVQMANLDELICVAEVEAGDVAYLQPSQKAAIKSRSFQGTTLEGSVIRIGNQVGQAGLRPLDPRQPVDRDVTQVVVQIDSKKAARLISLPGRDRRAALVGLQVEVTFPLK